MEAVGYIIQDEQGNAIFGIGETVDEAWQMVVEDCGPWEDGEGNLRDPDDVYLEDFTTYGATQALLDRVREIGGAISWSVVGGVACTREEAEEA